jgi:hypothetical protein
MKTKIILHLLLLLILVSCNSKKEKHLKGSDTLTSENASNKQEAQIETAFSDLGKRYPELKTQTDSPYLNDYTLVTSIERHNLKMRFNVLQSKKEKDLFVLTIEYRNKMSAIPIFPYSAKCYWNYENETNNCNSTPLNFRDEYNKMLSDLSLDDSMNLAYVPYYIISNHVLFLETMRLQDTTVVIDNHAYCISQENTPAGKKRNNRNMQDIIKLIHPSDGMYSYLTGIDKEFDYVFWAEPKRKPTKKVELMFKAFNFRCKEPLVFI